MRALMLAAGVGRRLFGDRNEEPPKSLLEFGGQTLLARHVAGMVACGVRHLTVVVGHQREAIGRELERVAPPGFVTQLFNPRYREGPKLSAAVGTAVLTAGEPVLFADADVLYDDSLLSRLLEAKSASAVLFDREFQSADDPVRVCLREGRLVDFGKETSEPHDVAGEWPGLCKLAAADAARFDESLGALIRAGRTEGPYEEAMHAVMFANGSSDFGVVDVSGLPWIEIDCAADLEKATTQIFPRIEVLSRARSSSSREDTGAGA